MDRRKRRRGDLKQRLASTVPHGRQECWVFGCKRPPGNASGDGLGRFCKPHLEHYRRHGDPLKGSYSAAETAPHRKAASAWIETHREDPFVAAALGGVEAAMLGAGKAIEPNQLRGLSTEEKARAVWARLREKGRKPREVLAAILGVAMRYAADYQRAKPEHRTVQIAKVLNRMGGGRVKRWRVDHPGAVDGVLTLRWFPSSEGLVLRELGQSAEKLAEFLIHDRIGELVEFSAKRREEAAMRSLPFSS